MKLKVVKKDYQSKHAGVEPGAGESGRRERGAAPGRGSRAAARARGGGPVSAALRRNAGTQLAADLLGQFSLGESLLAVALAIEGRYPADLSPGRYARELRLLAGTRLMAEAALPFFVSESIGEAEDFARNVAQPLVSGELLLILTPTGGAREIPAEAREIAQRSLHHRARHFGLRVRDLPECAEAVAAAWTSAQRVRP